MWFIIARRCDIHSSLRLSSFFAFIHKHQSLFCLSPLSLFVCDCFMCDIFFNYLLIYCIHILYKNQHFTHFVSVLMVFFFEHCYLNPYDIRRMCFISNYFTINLQMHLYNARFAWASLYCSTCQKHCLGNFCECIRTNVKAIAPHKLWFPI